MTVDELRSYRDALKRLKATGGPPYEPPAEDLPIWQRAAELHEEVRGELEAPA